MTRQEMINEINHILNDPDFRFTGDGFTDEMLQWLLDNKPGTIYAGHF